MFLYNLLIEPFVEFGFMRYALVSTIFLALSAAPIGVFLVMRRMSLMGDALSHAVLPGAAVGFMMAGLSIPMMSLGGFVAGVIMAVLAGLASRFTSLKEDANFAGFYLMSLALGVLLVSRSGSGVDLLHLLFGSVLAVDEVSLTLVAIVASITLLLLAVMYRPLMLESIDPVFLKAVKGKGSLWHVLFMMLVVINLVAGFQALGTLMAVGLMMLPAISAKLWAKSMAPILLLAMVIALVCSWGGLVLSYHIEVPSGPAIIILCGVVYIVSLVFGLHGGVLAKFLRGKHHQV